MITGRQIKAARALLGWDASELAVQANMTRETVSNIENSLTQPRESTLSDIIRALNDNGLELTDNEGVRFKPKSVEIVMFEAINGFSKFYDFVYEYLSAHGGDVCVSGVDEKLFSKYRQNPEEHRNRMAALVKQREDISMRILIEEGDYNFAASAYAKYRWQLKEYFSPTSFYAFGECLALISFTNDPPPLVILIKSSAFAEAYRHSFSLAWTNAKEPPVDKKRS